MNSETCACPKCTCQPGADAVERDGQHYCCAACASGHPRASRVATPIAPVAAPPGPRWRRIASWTTR